MTHDSTLQADRETYRETPAFPACEEDTPYNGEQTPVESVETCHGGALLDLDLKEDDRIAVWVSGHWQTGTITGTHFEDPEDITPGGKGQYKVFVELDDTHRDDHEDLPTPYIKLMSSTDAAYKHGPDGWKTVDISVRRKPGSSVGKRRLLGVCGGVKRIPDTREPEPAPAAD